jgi:hypothetical protein
MYDITIGTGQGKVGRFWLTLVHNKIHTVHDSYTALVKLVTGNHDVEHRQTNFWTLLTQKQ